MQEYVNEEAQNLIDSGQIRIEDIGNNKESYLPLMENICSKMINALRRRSVIPTLYIRDLDPDSLPPEKYRSFDGEIACGTGKIHRDFHR